MLALIASLLVQLWAAAGISFASASGPVKVSTYPADNDSYVPANASFKLVFDETVTRGSGAVEIRNSGTNIAVTSSVGISGNTVTINPSANLISGNSYYVYIEPTAFYNSAGQAYAGINDATAWNFDVIAVDTTRPTATTTPANGGTMLSTSALKLAFSEPVFAATGYIRITQSGTSDTQVISVLSSAVTRYGDDKTFLIQPPTRLVSGKSYQVSIDNNAFVDVVGLAYSPTTWTFTTLAPAVSPPISLSPSDNASGVGTGALTAAMTFAGAMQKGTSGTIQLKRISDNVTVDTINMATQSSRVTLGSGNAVVGIQFSGSLTANTGYYILMDPGVLKDASGNVYEGIIDPATWNFTTLALNDTTAPVIVPADLIPLNGGTTSAVNGSLKLKFNEPVKLGSGSIVIQRTTSPTGVFCSIPVTSGAIVGSGTDTLTITPSASVIGCGNFAQNAQYSVLIGNTAIVDLANNPYAGNLYSPWTFRVTADSTAPELVGLSPASGNQAVKTSATFTMTFSEDIDVPTGAAVLIPTSGASITAPITRDGTNARIAKFDVTGLQSSMQYIVRIPNTSIKDVAQNAFPGILNDYRWTFKTIGSDRTAPTVSSVAMDGSAVVLTYNEELDADYVPYPGNYYVTVNDVPKQVNAVTVKGSTVRLSLQSGVTVGQVLKVYYSLDGDTTRRLQDLSGNYAAALNGQAVTNTSDTTLPRPSTGILAGSSVVLTFNKPLQAIAGLNASQFSVKVGGYSQSVYGASISGSTLTLTLYNVPTGGQAVSVSYVPGSTPIRDASGNAAVAFTDFYVQSTYDTTAPMLSSATFSGSILRLNYNEGLLPTSVPLKSNFSVMSNGQAVSISNVTVANNVVELTLSQAIATGAAVYVSYIPGSPGIFDLSGNPAAAIVGQLATAGSGTGDSTVATVSGNVMQINYSTILNPSYVPYASQYFIKSSQSNYYGVTSVNVLGTTVLLTLSSAVATNDAVTVSYSNTGVQLRDSSNVVLPSFVEKSVSGTNGGGTTTPTPVNLPDYLEADGGGGVRLVSSKTSTNEYATLPSGKSGTKYNLDATKLSAAFEVIKSSANYSITKPMLTFSVPSSESGAFVSLPVRVLMDAANKASNASFRVDYGDYQFTLPLSAVNYSSELSKAGADALSTNLIIKIEKTQDSNLSSAIYAQSGQLLAMPTDFSASLSYAGREKEIESYSSYVSRSFKLTSTAGAASNVSVVRFDSNSNELVYVPTKVSASGNVTTVEFKRKHNSSYAVISKNTAFSDMTKHWANADVSLLASKLIVEGTSRTDFTPDRNITRAEFSEYLARGLGLNGDKATAVSRYKDVSASNAAASYIGAVSNAGIVTGDPDGKFRPNASVTREEMASMLVRAMTYAGVSIYPTATALSDFSDSGQVSTWAKDGMSVCVMTGFIQGITSTKLAPQSNATRAQATSMIKRFLQYADLL